MGKPFLARLLAVLTVAGCLGASRGSSADQDDSESVGASAVPGVGDDAGTIVGTVVDDAVQPIAGALVYLHSNQANTTTDDTGQFQLSAVSPGDQHVVANALGYKTASKRVSVVAGETASVQLVLEPLAVLEPHSEVFILRKFWTCAVATLVGVPNCGALSASDLSRAEHRFDFEVGKNWNTTQIELMWRYSNPGQTTTPGAWFNNQGYVRGSTQNLSLGEVFGKSAPVRVQFSPGLQYRGDGYRGTGRAAFPDDAYHHYAYAFPLGLFTSETQPIMDAAFSGSRSRGVGLSLYQPWTAYVSVFYIDPPPVGYTAIPDE